jgi:2-dehydro-3-deoxygluconokinase
MTVLCVGEMMIELSRAPDGALRMGFGGDTFNTAVYLARLGQPAAYLTAFGDDPWSAEARGLLRAEGVDDSACPTAAGRTMGLYAIRTTAAGERSFTYWRDSAPARDLFLPPLADGACTAIRSARLIYLSGITLWLYDAAGRERLFAALAAARRQGARVAFDGNYRPRLWGPDPRQARPVFAAMLEMTDICLASDADEALLWGDAGPAATLDRLTRAGVGEVVVKCGAEGALLTGGTAVPTAANPAPVDTTAAGDSFNAAYLAARLAGHDPRAAAAAGHRLAGRVIAHPGALIPRADMPAAD